MIVCNFMAQCCYFYLNVIELSYAIFVVLRTSFDTTWL